jgi:4-hydroxyphenylpyruvate dioxygenase
VHGHRFEQQIEAAVVGGFDTLTVPVRKYRTEVASGKTPKDLLAIARDNGVTLDYLDGMSSWSPIAYPVGADDFLKDALGFTVDEAFQICDVLDLRNIVVISGFNRGDLSLPQLVESFGRFCEAAAARGIWVDLEPMPMLGIPTLHDAWDIVRGANCANSGVLVDTWHFMRGGPDMHLLSSIPRGRIVNVQLADGMREPQGASLWEDAVNYRMFPGEGQLPIVEILRVLNSCQSLRSVGPEVMSLEVNRMSPQEIGQRAAATMAAVMVQAGMTA